jgi:hypothetical protein
LVVVTGSNGKSLQNLVRTSRAYGPVGSFKFGPCLFNQHHPYLLLCRFTKHRPVGLSEYRNIIVNHHFKWHTLVDNYELVDAVPTDLKIAMEDVLDPLLNFSQGGNGGKKVAVSDVALNNIIRLELVLYHYAILDNFSDSLPGKLTTLHLVAERFLIRRELVVNKAHIFSSALLKILVVL